MGGTVLSRHGSGGAAGKEELCSRGKAEKLTYTHSGRMQLQGIPQIMFLTVHVYIESNTKKLQLIYILREQAAVYKPPSCLGASKPSGSSDHF